jgi:nucleoside-diphosphate-sugar epimerase
MGFKHVVPHLAERFLINKESPFKIYGHNQTRSFCYVSDAVTGTISAAESKKSDGEIYHIGSDEEITIEELIKFAGNYFEYDGDYENAQTFPGSTARRCPDISKAKKDLGFKPQVHWKEAIKLTLSWYKNFFEDGNHAFEASFEEPENV